jgi:hypothetical protein
MSMNRDEREAKWENMTGTEQSAVTSLGRIGIASGVNMMISKLCPNNEVTRSRYNQLTSGPGLIAKIIKARVKKGKIRVV